MSKDLRIIFLGTPDFAVASLRELVEHKINIVAVVTAPDKPQGRGKKLGTSEVKKYAQKVGLSILQPTNLKSPEFIEELKSFQADLQIVVAFRMLPEAVWNMPPLGTFNLHGSLLPQYRGAAPINWAIINGEKETGVTTFFLKHEIDTGEIIFQETEEIRDDDTVGTLYLRLMEKGAKLVLKTVQAIMADTVTSSPQSTTSVIKHAPKIFKEHCEIDWNQPSQKVRNFIRGLSPYPGAWTHLDGKVLKVFGAELIDNPSLGAGHFEMTETNELYVSCYDLKLKVTELQMEGKKRMDSKSFLLGYSKGA